MSVQTRKLIGRSMALLVALTMIGAMIAACAPAAPAPAAQPTAAPAAEATAAPAAAAEKVPLRFVVMDYDEKMRPDTQALVDEFNASQNEIEVKLDVLGWGEGHDTLLTQISGGQAPDLANGNAQWVGEWSGINELQPLNDLLSTGVPGELRAGRPRGVHHRRQADGDALLPRPPRALLPQGPVREGGPEGP